MTVIATAAVVLLCAVVWAMLQPYFVLHQLSKIPVSEAHKAGARASIAAAHRNGWLTLPYNLGAFPLVPFLLLFRDRQTGWLPAWCDGFNNDVSNFGDADWIASHKGNTRGYFTMVRWLWRNRASRNAQKRGYHWQHFSPDGGGMDRETLAGDPAVADGALGVVLYRGESVYQVMGNLPFGPFVLRFNYGYKVWGTPNLAYPTAIVVADGATLRGR